METFLIVLSSIFFMSIYYELNKLIENNDLCMLLSLALVKRKSVYADDINDAVVECMDRLCLLDKFESVENLFIFQDLNKLDDKIVFKLIDILTEYSDCGPLFATTYDNPSEEIQKKIDDGFITFIDRLYNSDKKNCIFFCELYSTVISDEVSLKCIDTLAKLDKFSSIKDIINENHLNRIGNLKVEVNEILSKYDKGTLQEIPKSLSKLNKNKKDKLKI